MDLKGNDGVRTELIWIRIEISGGVISKAL
jgi:hypothetical protein